MKAKHFSLLLLVISASCATVVSPEPVAQGGEGAGVSEGWSQRVLSPVTQPTIFESPVIQSELRPMFLHQRLPSDSAFGGGHFQLYAVQARFAVTERLAIIATKDGFIDFNPNMGTDESGWANIAAGLKYAVVDNPESGILVTPGLIYEFDSGDKVVFQGNGDGIVRPFVSAGWDRDRINLIGTLGWNQPVNTSANSTSIDYHLHVDYDIDGTFVPLVEINGITYVKDGNAAPFNFEGGDLINLGSANVEGNTVITGAIGTRIVASDRVNFGLAYEVPLSGREDLLDSRLTVDMIWTF